MRHLACLGLCLGLTVMQAHAEEPMVFHRYAVTALQMDSAFGRKINGSGAIVGRNGMGTSAFVWEPSGNVRFLQIPGQGIRNLTGINDAGWVTGNLDGVVNGIGTSRAYIFHPNGDYENLAARFPDNSWAGAINNQNDVVGTYHGDGSISAAGAFHLSNGVLHTVPASDGNYVIFQAINNNGVIAGERYDSVNGGRKGIVYRDGQFTEFSPIGGSEVAITDINDRDIVVGSSSVPSGEGGHPFMWIDGVVTDLAPQGPGWGPNGINNENQIVGIGNLGAVIWTEGRVARLSQLIDPEGGWRVTSAYDINDSGQIVADGCNALGVCTILRLDPLELVPDPPPIPEPTSVAMLLAGLAVVTRSVVRATGAARDRG